MIYVVVSILPEPNAVDFRGIGTFNTRQTGSEMSVQLVKKTS